MTLPLLICCGYVLAFAALVRMYQRMRHRDRLVSELLNGLQDFTDKLQSGEPIEATRVERYETPDGPMHVSRKVTLQPRRNAR